MYKIIINELHSDDYGPLFENSSQNTHHLVINGIVPRGIDDFIEFANIIKYAFPNLKILEFSQNYSYEFDKNNFSYFINLLQLDELILYDSQTRELYGDIYNDEKLFSLIPDDSFYFIGNQHPRRKSDEFIKMVKNKIPSKYSKFAFRENKVIATYYNDFDERDEYDEQNYNV